MFGRPSHIQSMAHPGQTWQALTSTNFRVCQAGRAIP